MGGGNRLRQKTTCECIESLLKLGSKEKNEENSNTKSNKRKEGEKRKEIKGVSRETFVNSV